LSCTRALENQVDAELRRLGFIVRSRIKPQDARTIGLARLPGEIDHIAVRVKGGTLWVIDDKDLAGVFTPAEFVRNVVQFFDDRKGEVHKLQAKVDVIASNVRDVANAMGAPLPTSVTGLFVSRSPIPAAFVSSAPVLFTTLRELPVVVGAD
jgi:hypothetical protein